MSFGFGIGDILATLHLFKTIVVEIKNYRDAPANFQQLQVELELLQNTLCQVLHAEPSHDEEKELIDRVRAIAMHCHGPLRVFLDKMRPKAGTLGHFGKTTTISNVGLRLHWSIVTQKDVEGLRKIIISEMVAITILLSMRQITELKRLGVKSHQIQSESLQVLREAQCIRTQNDTILRNLSGTSTAISDIRDLFSANTMQQTQQTTIFSQGLGNLVSQMKSLALSCNRTFEIIGTSGAQVRQGVVRISTLLRDIQQLIQILAYSSREMLAAIAQNTCSLLNICRQMKRIVRTIEAIPLHLTLDIIRLDDALGESWGLPFQACTNWTSFKNILLAVVFANGRVGASRIQQGRFIITSATTGRLLSPLTWEEAVKAGMHLHQAIVIDEKPNLAESCPYPSCGGTLDLKRGPDEGFCSTCGRCSITLDKLEPIIQELKPLNIQGIQPEASTSPPPLLMSAHPLPRIQAQDENIELYRRVQFYRPSLEIKSIDEARAILAEDALNASANRYSGWWSLTLNKPFLAAGALQKATTSSPFDSQSWYLLGRAYLKLHEFNYDEALRLAHGCFQAAVRGNSLCPDYWLSVGALYYRGNQYLASLDAVARAIRLNHHLPLGWYNLGILYNVVGQDEDTITALGRALELDPRFPGANDIVQGLQTKRGYGENQSRGPSGLGLEMHLPTLLHVSDTSPLAQGRQDIHINPLHVHPDDNLGRYDIMEDEWEDISDDDLIG